MAPRSFLRWIVPPALVLYLIVVTTASPLLAHQADEVAAAQNAETSNLRRRQGGASLITGVTGAGVQPRLEIRQLQQQPDQWNLYLLGMVRFMASTQSDKLSYYQISGIHGRPYIPWDGVPAEAGITDPGYCAHVSNLFLPWHRPYLALFEQELYQHVLEAVNSFPAGATRQRYAAAALLLRAPYWDWAAVPANGQSVFPSVVTQPTISVTMANGTNTIPNPLFSYRFHPVVQSDFYYTPFTFWNATLRSPTNSNANATSQNSQVASVLENNRVSFQDRLYNLFTNYNNFTEFGNEAWMGPNVSNADSVESIHDVIHGITGNDGHMTYLDYAAFDPLFWLHHAMIDRVFAMWQTIYNDSYVEPMAAVMQSYTTAVGETRDVNSPLEPFHRNANGDFWTSVSVRSTNTFGYTYSDLGNGSVAAVKAAVNKLYGTSAGSGGVSKRSSSRSSSTQTLTERELPAAANANATTAPNEVSDGKYIEYVANIVSKKFAVDGSYAIYLFLGDFDDTPAAWPLSPNLVGTHVVFAALARGDASNNPQAPGAGGSGLQVTGTVPLTSMLLAKVQAGALSCMDVEAVVPYLVKNLHWRVGMFDGTQVPAANLGDLGITVVSAEVEPAPAIDQFPQWGPFDTLISITQSSSCGCAAPAS